MQSNSFKISITAFLSLTSILMIIGVIAFSFGSINSMESIGKKIHSVRALKLPQVRVNQRALSSLENIRHLSGFLVTSNRRNFQKQTLDRMLSIYHDTLLNKTFNKPVEANKLIVLAKKLFDLRGDELDTWNTLVKLRAPLVESTARLQELLKEKNIYKNLVEPALVLSVFQEKKIMRAKQSKNVKATNIDADYIFFNTVDTLCEKQVSEQFSRECVRFKKIEKNYKNTLGLYKEKLIVSIEHWKILDDALLKVFEAIRNDAEFEIVHALVSVENSAQSSIEFIYLLAGIGATYFTFYLFALLFILVRPIRWVGRKLIEIQQGILHSPTPTIAIKELYQVSDLLDRFSSHIAELTSHASMLEEDAAIKKELEELMATVFKVSVNGYVIWNPQQKLSLSKDFLSMAGLSEADDSQDSWESIGFTKEVDLHEFYNKVLTIGVIQREVIIVNDKGEGRPFHVTDTPIKRRGGISVFSYFRDLRQQKKIEAELRASKNHAEEAARVKSDFLARMSHEIRTPMNGVLGLTDIALKKSPPPEQKTYLKKIQASAQILLGVINDILDFSKLESGKVTLEKNPFSFSNLVSTIQDLFLFQAEQGNVSFSIESTSDIPERLLGDEIKLSQVLINLCGNAMKFTESGSITVKVSLESRVNNLLRIKFLVIDTGIGMTEEQLQTIFKPFSQADSSTTRKYGGTGLGLVISDLLIKIMKGNLIVSSELGQGSTFSFVIELEEDTTQQVQITEEQQAPTSPTSLQGLQILLVEDNEINQEVAVAILEDLGCSVEVASNGKEALKLLGTIEVDCVLMDIQMPIMDGLTATRAIRQSEKTIIRELPVIAMTAHAMKEDREKSFVAGMSDHVTKPINPTELITALAKIKKKANNS